MSHKTKLASATLLTAAVFAAPSVWADKYENDSGFYVGGSYGGYKSHGGEFEADYLDFGEFGEDDEVNGDLKGLGLAVRGRLPITDSFGVYAKAGAFASALDVDAFDEDETYDEVSPFVGAGVDFRISEMLSADAEYDRYNVDIDEDDFNGQVTNDGPEFDTARVGMRVMF